MRKLVTLAMLAAITILGTAGACQDPGNPKTGGKPHKVMVWISPGSHKITKDYYGLWSAVTEAGYGQGAKPSCRWSITKGGKIVQSGGWKDRMIISHGLHGGTVTVGASCYRFEK